MTDLTTFYTTPSTFPSVNPDETPLQNAIRKVEELEYVKESGWKVYHDPDDYGTVELWSRYACYTLTPTETEAYFDIVTSLYTHDRVMDLYSIYNVAAYPVIKRLCG